MLLITRCGTVRKSRFSSPLRRNANELRKRLPMPWMRAAVTTTNITGSEGSQKSGAEFRPRYAIWIQASQE
jgi:hypothetical protein